MKSQGAEELSCSTTLAGGNTLLEDDIFKMMITASDTVEKNVHKSDENVNSCLFETFHNKASRSIQTAKNVLATQEQNGKPTTEECKGVGYF